MQPARRTDLLARDTNSADPIAFANDGGNTAGEANRSPAPSAVRQVADCLCGEREPLTATCSSVMRVGIGSDSKHAQRAASHTGP